MKRNLNCVNRLTCLGCQRVRTGSRQGGLQSRDARLWLCRQVRVMGAGRARLLVATFPRIGRNLQRSDLENANFRPNFSPERYRHRGATHTRVTPMTAHALRLLVPVFALGMHAASVETTFAFSFEARLKCTGDAYRLCSSEVPHVGRITACMKQQRELLSAGCRDVMERDEAAAGLQGSQSRAQNLAAPGRPGR